MIVREGKGGGMGSTEPWPLLPINGVTDRSNRAVTVRMDHLGPVRATIESIVVAIGFEKINKA